jgi:hypothetical protein
LRSGELQIPTTKGKANITTNGKRGRGADSINLRFSCQLFSGRLALPKTRTIRLRIGFQATAAWSVGNAVRAAAIGRRRTQEVVGFQNIVIVYFDEQVLDANRRIRLIAIQLRLGYCSRNVAFEIDLCLSMGRQVI